MSETLSTYLPWHESHWKVLQRRKAQDQLPHALLLMGTAGVGKRDFARQLAKSLLCMHPDHDGLACGQCNSCQWIETGTHPDWFEIAPEDEKKQIKVDQIRELVEFNYKTARVNQSKAIIIHSAHALNKSAANALLKTLEEPSPDTLIILMTDNMMMLPATVRSRCQILYFSIPTTQVALSWLNDYEGIHQNQELEVLLSLAHGAPLKVLKFLEENEIEFRKEVFTQWLDWIRNQISLVSLAEKWNKLDLNRLLIHWKTWIGDMIRLKQVSDETHIKNQDMINDLKEIALKSDVYALYRFLDELNQSHHGLKACNLNPQLVIENLLIQWLEVKHAVS